MLPIPPPPIVFNLTHTDRIRLVAVLQTERNFLLSLFQRTREDNDKLTTINKKIDELLSTLTQP